MPRFVPFPGLRYDSAQLRLDDVIAPPYDVVDDTERAVLAARSPHNAIHVELPVDEPGTANRYAAAATRFRSWAEEKAILRDAEPNFYVYRMHYRTESGEQRSTTGVLGALGLDTVGDVLPHERTMPKPKGDRLDLLRACRANLSPIWGLSLAGGLADACNEAAAGAAPFAATDDEGVVHELWPVPEGPATERISALVASRPIVIADGHHRFETANFFREEERERNGDVAGDHNLVMALVVELSPEELFVQAIHRLVKGLPAGFDLRGVLSESFRIESLDGGPDALAAAMTRKGGLGLLAPDGNAVLIPLPIVEERAEAALDSSRLDVALAELPPHELIYQHGLAHVAEAVASGAAQVGFLLRPATVEQIAETAHSGRRMPPKTTFFQPKPRTGMVYRSV